MTTQKITIMGKFPEIEWRDVPATIVNINPKYVCFVHRDSRYYQPDGSPELNRQRPHYFSTWVVSEQSTGASITTGKTRKQAIENAINKLREVGDAGMEIALKTYRERVKSYELVLN